MLFFSVQ